MNYRVRLARADEVNAVAQIELSASEKFRRWPGFEWPPDFHLPRPERYREAVSAGRVIVAVDTDDGPIGFAELSWLGDEPYLGGLHVAFEHQGKGLGRALLAGVCDWAREQSKRTLLLSTRRDLPWNAPYYARLGFVEIALADYTPALQARYEREAQFQDMRLRVIMRKLLQDDT